MFATRPTPPVSRHTIGNGHGQLASNIVDNRRGDGRPVLHKRAEKPEGPQLYRPSQLLTIPAERAKELAIRIVEIEILGELGRGRVAGIPAVLRRLLPGEEIDRRGNPPFRGKLCSCLTWVHPVETPSKARVVAVSSVSYACLINHTEKGAVGR